MKIWQRSSFGRLIRTFLFFLSCILILYVAVDFSLYGVRLLSKVQMFKFIPLFFSLSFLLASLRVLLDLKSHGEFTALQIAGLSLKKLLSPLFFLAALLALVSYANFQWAPYEAAKKAQKVLS